MGLHENANISQAIYEAANIFSNVIKIGQSSKEEAGSESEQMCRTMTQNILKQIREPFKTKEIE